jgi:hypothetical protein
MLNPKSASAVIYKRLDLLAVGSVQLERKLSSVMLFGGGWGEEELKAFLVDISF